MSVIENIMNIPAEHEKNVFGSFDGNIKNREDTLCDSYCKRFSGKDYR